MGRGAARRRTLRFIATGVRTSRAGRAESTFVTLIPLASRRMREELSVPSLQRFLIAVFALLVVTGAVAQAKPRIEKEADLPRFTYTIEDRVEDVVRDDAKFARPASNDGK